MTRPGEYEALLRADFASFVQHCFRELNPRTQFALSWHHEIIAAKLEALRNGDIRRVIINMPPRHLKSFFASVALPACCLGTNPARRSSASPPGLPPDLSVGSLPRA
jgi:hypothetical protein